MRIEVVYEAACPVCGGEAEASRLRAGLPCSSCLPDPPPSGGRWGVLRELAANGRLGRLAPVYSEELVLRRFEEFFEEATGSRMWGLQRVWARRLLRGESLALAAPTGTGKSTLLSVYALYRARGGDKVLVVTPTAALVEQAASRIRGYAERVGFGGDVVAYYHSGRRGELRRIEAGDYHILVVTPAFILRRWGLLEGKLFAAALVDDVDSVLRSWSVTSKLLQLIGFTGRVVELARRAARLRSEARAARAAGRSALADSLEERLASIEAELVSELAKCTPAQLVVASATARGGQAARVLRELLGFTIGRVGDSVRSVSVLLWETGDPLNAAVAAASAAGDGGIVFVSKLYSSVVQTLARELEARGLRVAVAKGKASARAVNEFSSGEVDVLIASASYYGVAVRGIDTPRAVYALFLGVPCTPLPLSSLKWRPRMLVEAALKLGVEGAEEAARLISRLTPLEVKLLSAHLRGKISVESPRLLEAAKLLEGLASRVAEAAEGREVTLNRGVIVDGKLLLLDFPTFLQASGRTSRLHGDYMTHGVAVVVESVGGLLESLRAELGRVGWGWRSFNWRLLGEELERARRSRVDPSAGRRVRVKSVLIVVESPTKAKTIAGFYGKPSARRVGPLIAYETSMRVGDTLYVATITATAGHIYDLTLEDRGIYGVEVTSSEVRPVYATIRRCSSCGRTFAGTGRCPYCGSEAYTDKASIIDALRRLALDAEEVMVATDPDAEGEKIAFDVEAVIKPFNERVSRIEFHAVTRRDFEEALARPRSVNTARVEAQVLRRIEDRWIGFTLSRWLQERLGRRNLGAGRVQTPVLGWAVARYREWRDARGYLLVIKLPGGVATTIYYSSRREAEAAAEEARRLGVLVEEVESTVEEVQPPPPYTTDELLADASRQLGLPSSVVMKLAQDLFEMGLITYHRTDSTRVSDAGVAVASQLLGKLGLPFTPRRWGEGGAHECIRPTKPLTPRELEEALAIGAIRPSKPVTKLHLKLYSLIVARFAASQSAPQLARRRVLRIHVSGAATDIVVYEPLGDGHLSVYPSRRVASGLEPGLVVPESVRVVRGSRVRLYTEGELVKLMRERGIGRPSTYSRTLEVLRRHGYIVRSKRVGYVVPTRLGVEVYELLSSSFPSLVSEERTARLLTEMDAVEEGRLDATSVLGELLSELRQLSLPVPAVEALEGA